MESSLYLNFIIFIIVIKILFIFSTISILFLKHKNETKYEKLIKTLTYVRDKTRVIFKLSVSLLLLILFNPRQKNNQEINYEAKLILYLYGILTIIETVVEYFR
jgi:cobalamin synthase